MTDNNLIKAFRQVILDMLSSNGISDCAVVAANQPTRQGVQIGKIIYFTKILDRRYGFLHRDDVYNQLASDFEHTETQAYESTFQISALYIPPTSETDDITASDLVNLAASIMQSDYAREELRKKEIGIIKITDVRNPYFINDKDRYEASPSFDFTLLYNRTLISNVPAVTTYDHVIESV